MAVNLINSNDINVVQSDTDISLETNKTTLNTIIDSRINNYMTYSTTEQRAGTWIDGKPLYRKVVHISSLPNNTIAFYDVFSAGEINTIDKYFIDDSGSYMISVAAGNTEVDTMNWIYSTTGFVMTCMRNKQIRIKTTDDKSGSEAYVSVCYTKTTD